MSAGHPYHWRVDEIETNAPALARQQARHIARACAAAGAADSIARALSVNLTNETIPDTVRLSDGTQGGMLDAIQMLAAIVDSELEDLVNSFIPKEPKP